LRDFPGEGVLTSSAADDQDFHAALGFTGTGLSA
jgi:hypothetical protein